jgi:heme/copper-type cytochrome/quinol oxidase subunit 4
MHGHTHARKHALSFCLSHTLTQMSFSLQTVKDTEQHNSVKNSAQTFRQEEENEKQ